MHIQALVPAHRRRVSPFFLFSVAQLGSQVVRMRPPPPFTLALLGAHTLFYLKPGWLLALTLSRRLTNLYMVPAAVVESWGLRRLFLSAMVHDDHYHLYYNATALLFEGDCACAGLDPGTCRPPLALPPVIRPQGP